MIKITSHSSIEISGSRTIWFDPFKIDSKPGNADIVFITHSHYDHYSPEDIDKIRKEDTILIAPKGVCDNADIIVQPGESFTVKDVSVETVPAYNKLKPFHPKSKKWVGYLVEMDGVRYYICGDTDITEEAKSIKCDCLLVPCGGTYTMNASEAAKLANIIQPEKAIPTHYGSVVGSLDDGIQFKNLLDSSIDCELLIQ